VFILDCPLCALSGFLFRSLAQYSEQSWESPYVHSLCKATNPEGKLCFLKRFQAVAGDAESKQKAHKQFQASMAAVRVLSHDSILRPTGYFVENNDYILEMPYCAGGTLSQWLRAGTRSLRAKYNVAVRLVAALKYMHSQGTRFVTCLLKGSL
jgi:serine/threonine protein kinase